MLPERLLILASLLLVAQGLLVYWIPQGETTPASPGFSALQNQVGDWSTVREDPIEAEIARELHADHLLNRTYLNTRSEVFANLFIAWFASQRNGAQPHSPKVCLPGSGWIPEATGEVTIPTAFGKITANRMLVSKANQRAVVLYWYQNPRRTIASEWKAKLWVIWDAIRYRQTDLALVRVTVWRNTSDEEATAQAERLAAEIYPFLVAASN